MSHQFAVVNLSRIFVVAQNRTLRIALIISTLVTGLGFAPPRAVAAPANVCYLSPSITTNQTWSTGNIYVAQSNVTVQPSVTVTIQGGAIVKFGSGTYLDVLGTLAMTGTVGNQVVFTSLKDDVGGDT